MELVAIISRFFHILSAIIAVGGLFLMWRLFLPALELVGENDQKMMLKAMARVWRIVLWHAFALLIGTGILNASLSWTNNATWQMLFGIKMILALALVAIGVYLTTPDGENPIKQRAQPVYTVAVLVGFAVVAVGAVLRFQNH